MSYNFSTLNDKDLEELARDILSKKLNLDFQSFKMGADKGIDLRYASTTDENEIIVQVKHFLNSGISQLKSELKKKEINKIKDLNPKRYILVTSLPLSPQNKEEIKTILSPFILSTKDILGKNDLNNFLRNNPDVEETHFKLWLSSTTVLKRILSNGVKGRSEFIEKKIKDRIRIFVPNKTHKNSVEILNKSNFILITGAPGIGKSTLADILTYQLLAKGYELIYVREILEAESAYLPGKKQVFYFDDFLGAITLDLKSSRNADASVVNFIEMIKNDKQKRLILTCRTTILNQANEESEKIGNSKMEVAKHEVKIEDYRNIDKARILYNHIYFSNLSDELKEVFFKDQFYWTVIKHKFYNPRIVEFFTDIDRLEPKIEYKKEVINFLDDPSRIWEKSYTIQISTEARFFLCSLYSLGGKYVVSEKKLKAVFDERLEYEVAHNNYVKETSLFSKTVTELVGGLIIRTHKIDKNNESIEYRFLNPSIEDFLYYHFSQNIDEYFKILKSAIYFEQFKSRITTKKEKGVKRVCFSENDYGKLLNIFIERLPYLNGSGTSKDLDTAVVLITLFKWEDIEGRILEIMNNLNIDDIIWGARDNLMEILSYIAENDLINKFNISFEELILTLSTKMTYHFEIEAFSKLISKHQAFISIIEKSRIENGDFYNKLQNNINKSWESSMSYYISQTPSINNITDSQELVTAITKRKEDAKKVNELLKINASPIIDTFEIDYQNWLNRNIANNLELAAQLKNLNVGDVDLVNEPIEINRLFNSADSEPESTSGARASSFWLEDDLPF